MTHLEPHVLSRLVGTMLASTSSADAISVTPMRKSGNNCLYRVETPDGAFVLKRYYQNPADTRNRLQVEYDFLFFAWQQGLRCIPQPIARQESTNCALYTFVEGEALEPGEVTREWIDDALQFFLELNDLRGHPDAQKLENGSESCFSVSEHIQCIQGRLDRLKGMCVINAVDAECLDFVEGPLSTAWTQVNEQLEHYLRAIADEPLAIRERVLSPSDFGFHNALSTGDRLLFLDFEYAGWDDPAKVVGDFFNQVAIPVDLKYFELFVSAIAALASDPQLMLARMVHLCPLYSIKWCCILLNEFLPTEAGRREFAQGQVSERKSVQLRKARRHVETARQCMNLTGGTQKNALQ